MSISPISALSAIMPSQGLAAASGVSGASALSALAATGGTTPTSGVDFAGAIDSLQATQSKADALAVKAVTGDLDDAHDYTIAATQAAVSIELTAAVRNKAVEAFSEIMRMQA